MLIIFLWTFITKVMDETSSRTLFCLCDHLTTFTGQFFVPPNKIDITDINIYKTIGHNYVTVIVVFASWSIYFSLLIWARSRDKKDIRKVGAGKMPAILFLIVTNDSMQCPQFVSFHCATCSNGQTQHAVQCTEHSRLLARIHCLLGRRIYIKALFLDGNHVTW